MTHTFPKLPFPPASISSVPFLHSSFGQMRALLCSLCFKPRRSLGPRRSSGPFYFMDLMHGVTCTHTPGTSPQGLELGIGAGASWTLPGSALPELGWSLGNLAGAQAFATEFYPCCCLSCRERQGFRRDTPQQAQESCWQRVTSREGDALKSVARHMEDCKRWFCS